MSMQLGVATSTAPIDPLLALLVGAFGAAILTVIGGLIGAWIQSIREHRKWLRERRLDAYLEFMTSMSRVTRLAEETPTLENAERVLAELHALEDPMLASGDAVSILGPRAVNAAGQDWIGAATAFAKDRSEANRDALRRGRWRFLIASGKKLKTRNVGENPPVARQL
ncbi:MAG: hypothetical protein ACRDNG_00740 [Gaiellaceae bacterium]